MFCVFTLSKAATQRCGDWPWLRGSLLSMDWQRYVYDKCEMDLSPINKDEG